MIEFKPRDVAIINLALAEDSFGVEREHNLSLIQKQCSQLADDDLLRVAHGVYMLDNLKPFIAENRRTACAWAKAMLPHSSFDLSELAGLLKHNVKTKQIADFLSQ